MIMIWSSRHGAWIESDADIRLFTTEFWLIEAAEIIYIYRTFQIEITRNGEEKKLEWELPAQSQHKESPRN